MKNYGGNMEEIDLKELIGMFLEKKFLIIAIVVIAAILGAVYTLKFIVPLYQSSTSLVLVQVVTDNNDEDEDGDSAISSTDIALNSNLVDDYREIAKSKSVATQVIENLKLDMTLTEVQNSISVSSISDTELIRITVTHADKELACKVANEVAKIFIGKVNEIYKVSNLHVLDEAEVSNTPSNINLGKNVIVFAFVGFVLVSAYILLINMLDTTVKTDTDIEKALKVPVLASIVFTDDSVKKKAKSSRSDNDIHISYQNNNIVASNNDLDNQPKTKHIRKGGND